MAIAQNNEEAEKIYQMGFENTTAVDSDEQRGAITGINRKRTETVVDHIVPHRGDQQLFWNQSNWQALCKPCHDHKTMTEDRWQEYKY